MSTIRQLALWCAVCSLFVTAQSWGKASVRADHITVELVSEFDHVTPGENWVGVRFQPDPHWHTYWRNPGDSGEAPTFSWTLPQGVTAGDIQWPLPSSIPVAHLVNYGYDGDVLLMVPVTLPATWQGDTLPLTLDVSWLVCKEDCIPGWATLSTTLTATENQAQNRANPLFEQTRATLPRPQLLQAMHEVNDTHLVLEVAPPHAGDWQVLPFRSDVIQHSGAQQRISDQGTLNIVVSRSDYFQAGQAALNWLLTDGNQGFYLRSEFNAAPGSQQNGQGLWILLLMAMAGGLILNLMPCVLPVLAIKAMSLQQRGSGSGLPYLAGVMLTFNLFAVAILLLKQAGHQLGWGFHLQQPLLVATLAFLFTYIALALLDAAPGGNRLTGLGQQHTQGSGKRAEFATGVLAVIVASPCTAPFMAAALGVALVSDALPALLIFNALGLGFALPMMLVSHSTRVASWLPKPGAWMQPFRQFLAFPMLATVCWLVWVYLQQTSAMAQFALLLALVVFSLFLWMANTLRHRPVLALSSSAVALAMLFIPSLSEVPAASGANTVRSQQAFSQDRLEALRADNQVVLVNMTADWCITCKVNEQVAFATDEVRQVLDTENVHYLEGDWTNKNAEILAFLQRYERAGVPLYVVYAGNDSYEVLPQVLTPGIVVAAINHALSSVSGGL